MPPQTIHIENLSKHYGTVLAVDSLSLEVSQGQFLALLGPSGCGKTTTLRLLAGFEQADGGLIDIKGQRVLGPKTFVPPEKRSVGMVFQSYALFPHLSVAKNIAYGLDKQAIKAGRIAEALDMVRLPNLGERMPHELSGGQQQRVALARALAPNPDLVLLDEPFSNLDVGLRATVRAEVRQILTEVGATAIFVTHDQEEALSLCDKVAVMLDGRLEQIGSPRQVYQRPASRAVATFVGEANFLPASVSGQRVTCELGETLTYSGCPQGSVAILLRPEDLHPTLAPNGPATITQLEYFGRDQALVCRLDSGTLVRTRLLGAAEGFSVGQRVRFTLPAQVMVYPQ